MAHIDMIGKKFGKLTVEEYVGNNKHKEKLWNCKCDCGNYKIVKTRGLTSGHTRSCGCLQNAEDLTGQRFNRLTVLERLPNTYDKNGTSYVTWLCQCDCGKTTQATTNNLKGKHVTSCGCYINEIKHTAYLKHGYRKTRLYSIYNSMKQRCNNSNNTKYKDYGGRGIKVCDEWNNSEGLKNFGDWALANGYQDDLTIDRIDVNGNYEPSNCRWITMHEQFKNTRRNKYITYKGKTMILCDWARELGIDHRKLSYMLKRGKTIEEIVLFYEQKKVKCEASNNKICKMA